MLGLFAQLGKSRKDSEHRMDVPTFQSRLSAMAGAGAVYAAAGVWRDSRLRRQMPSQTSRCCSNWRKHVAIRFALDSYEKGELRVKRCETTAGTA